MAGDNARLGDKVNKRVVGALTISHHSAAMLTMQSFVRAEHDSGNSTDCGVTSRLSASRISAICTKELRQGRKIKGISLTHS